MLLFVNEINVALSVILLVPYIHQTDADECKGTPLRLMKSVCCLKCSCCNLM